MAQSGHDVGKSRGTYSRSNSRIGTPVTTTDEPLREPQEQRKLTLDDAEVMVAAGRPGHR
jgi:hypothetical protein